MSTSFRRVMDGRGVAGLLLVAWAITGCGSNAGSSQVASNSAATPPASAAAASVAAPSPLPTTTPLPNPTIGSITPQAVFGVEFPTGYIGATDDAVWLFDSRGVTRIDPVTNTATRFALKTADGTWRPSYGGLVGLGSLWVSDFDYNEVRRYAPADGSLIATIKVDTPAGILIADGSLWVSGHRDGTVHRFDPATGAEVAAIQVGRSGPSGPHELAFAAGRVWVGIPNEGAVVAIDPAANTVAGQVKIAAPAVPCGGIAVDGQRLIVTSCADARAMAIVDIASMSATTTPEFDGYVGPPIAVGTARWVAVGLSTAGALQRVDPLTLAPGKRHDIPFGAPLGTLVAFGSFWVAVEHETEQAAWLIRLPIAAFTP